MQTLRGITVIVISLFLFFGELSSAGMDQTTIPLEKDESIPAKGFQAEITSEGTPDSGTKIYRLPGPAKALEEKSQEAQKRRVIGKVIAVDTKGNVLIVKGRKAAVRLYTDEKTSVMISDKRKNLTRVKRGDTVNVQYEVTLGKNIAKSIVVRQTSIQRSEEERKD